MWFISLIHWNIGSYIICSMPSGTHQKAGINDLTDRLLDPLHEEAHKLCHRRGLATEVTVN